MANSENTDNTEPTVRKTWQFGHFQTKHDGRKWRLVRTHSTLGWKLFGDDLKVMASNKSATPLVTLARELSRVEKRDLKINKLRAQVATLSAQLNDLTDAVEAEAAAADEVSS